MATPLVLITHTGIFHADDIMSSAFLRSFFSDRDIDIIRTTDVNNVLPNFDKDAEINITPDGREAIVYDIGKGRFDHHQIDSPCREAGFKYCSFGLLWKRYGLEYLKQMFPKKSNEDLRLAHKNIDKTFVCHIDLQDNGGYINAANNYIPLIIQKMNPPWNQPAEQMNINYFMKAVDAMQQVLVCECQHQVAYLESVAIISDAVMKATKDNRRYIVLDQYVPYNRYILSNPEAKDLLYVVYPSSHTPGEWCVGTIDRKLNFPGARKMLPRKLWGRDREELLKYNWTFVHHTGFLGSALTKQDAIKLAVYSINYNDGSGN